MRQLHLTRNRAWTQQKYTDTFLIEDHIEDPEKALRAAVKNYLNTKDGKDAVIHSIGDFNWGNVITSIDDASLNKQGIYRTTNTDAIFIEVNQDEVLFHEVQEDILKKEGPENDNGTKPNETK